MIKKKYSFIFYIIIIILISFFLSKILINLLIDKTIEKGIEIVTLNPFSIINLLFSCTIIISLIISIPLLIYRVYKYCEDSLYEREKKIFKENIWWIILPIIGALFGIFFTESFLLPFLLDMMKSYNISQLIGFDDIVKLYLINSLIMSIIFMIPLFMKIMCKIGIISKPWLKQKRKYIYILGILILAIITPTTDVITLLTMYIPLIASYEGGLLLIKE